MGHGQVESVVDDAVDRVLAFTGRRRRRRRRHQFGARDVDVEDDAVVAGQVRRFGQLLETALGLAVGRWPTGQPARRGQPKNVPEKNLRPKHCEVAKVEATWDRRDWWPGCRWIRAARGASAVWRWPWQSPRRLRRRATPGRLCRPPQPRLRSIPRPSDST